MIYDSFRKDGKGMNVLAESFVGVEVIRTIEFL